LKPLVNKNNIETRLTNGEKLKAIPYGKQNITEEDIAAVVEVLKCDFLTQGPKIKEFEEVFANYIGAQYAVAVANGTAALHLNALALGVKPGDKVITTPITFAASANCVRYCGGEVVFADIDPETYLLDIHAVRKLLEDAPKGTYKGIIPVDFAGRAVDLETFRKLADAYGLWMIQDSCHSPGGYFIDSKGEKQSCGNGNFAELAIFSFHPVKHIASGEGGMITTNDEKLYKKLLNLRTHGITKNADEFRNDVDLAIGYRPLAFGQEPTANSESPTANRESQTANSEYPNWYMEMQELGYNYRLTDFQAALGLSQLKRADEGLQRRKEIAARYYEAFKNIPQITDRNHEASQSALQTANSEQQTANSEQRTANSEPKTANSEQRTANSEQQTANSKQRTAYRSPFTGHPQHGHAYLIESENRLGLYQHLRENNIFAQIHYIPVHLMPYYRQFGWKEGDLPNAEEYYHRCISLPMYPTLTDEEQEFVITTIKTYYGG
jgi:dTDP-4-amino-4,6-dideoxygalactose transaminase